MQVIQLILDAIFPRSCVSCQLEGKLFCDTCALNWQVSRPESHGEHLAIYAYANPIVRHLLRIWKYDFDLSAFKLLTEHAEMYWPQLSASIKSFGCTGLVPVPLSPQRLRERGFNQSELIAKWLASKLDLPVLPVLKRHHVAGHQAERTDIERRVAMADNPFYLVDTSELPENLLLIDDVLTTGATMAAAASVLNNREQAKVHTFSLAQG